MAFASRRFGPSDCSPNLYLFGFPEKKKKRNSVRNRHNEEHLRSFQSKIINTCMFVSKNQREFELLLQ